MQDNCQLSTGEASLQLIKLYNPDLFHELSYIASRWVLTNVQLHGRARVITTSQNRKMTGFYILTLLCPIEVDLLKPVAPHCNPTTLHCSTSTLPSIHINLQDVVKRLLQKGNMCLLPIVVIFILFPGFPPVLHWYVKGLDSIYAWWTFCTRLDIKRILEMFLCVAFSLFTCNTGFHLQWCLMWG
jgi:hypothetical protein